MSQDAELLKILRRQLSRFQRVLEALRASGCMGEVQALYESFAAAARHGPKEKTQASLDIFCESMRHTLISKGVSDQQAGWLAALARENLGDAISSSVNFDLVFSRAVAEWRDEVKRASDRRKRKKELGMAYSRLCIAGGAIVFDAAKFSLVSPAPTFLIASIVAGGGLFLQGLDRILSSAGSPNGG